MNPAIISFIMNKPRFIEAAARWVHSLRNWFSFDGDIILFVDDGLELPVKLRRQVEVRSLANVKRAVEKLQHFTKHWDGRGRVFIHKPFVLREVLEQCSFDVVLMADVDTLAVESLQPMFESCAASGKIMAPSDLPVSKSMHDAGHQNGFFTKSERDQADSMGMDPICAGFVMGPAERMRVMVERWIEVLTTRKYRQDGNGGLEEQAALNFVLFENPEWWKLMPGWVAPYIRLHGLDEPYWGWPAPSTRIWHFYGTTACLKIQKRVFDLRNAGRLSW